MKIRNYFLLFAVSIGITVTTSCGDSAEKTSSSQNPAYETIENDPTNTRIYTLDNGLKVYLSVNEFKRLSQLGQVAKMILRLRPD